MNFKNLRDSFLTALALVFLSTPEYIWGETAKIRLRQKPTLLSIAEVKVMVHVVALYYLIQKKERIVTNSFDYAGV